MKNRLFKNPISTIIGVLIIAFSWWGFFAYDKISVVELILLTGLGFLMMYAKDKLIDILMNKLKK